MMTVKDLFENEELMNNIVEDLEDFPEDTEVTYCVFALGYDKDEEPTEDEVLLGEFTDPDAAVEFAKDATLAQITEMGFGEPDPDTVYFSIEVETVVVDPEDEDGCTMNIGTIYRDELWLTEDDLNRAVAVTSKDFTILEDGTLKIKVDFLPCFNKNDCVLFEFVDEPTISFLEYKIMSKVIYADGDYYHCELMI
jgi:hypothetical protein